VQPKELRARGLDLLCSTNVSSYLMQLEMINNVQMTIEQYLGRTFNIRIRESRDTDLDDAAYLIMPGEGTGKHLYLTTAKFPLVEPYRARGVGEAYMVTKFFGTYVEPETQGGTTSNRIAKIDNTVS
jgi:hypothetical protein